MSLNLDKSTWKRAAFGDVVRNVNESVRDPRSQGIDRAIAMEHLESGELKIDRWGSLADGTTFTRLVKPGQTLFGKRRAYQRKVAYAEFDAVCSGDILTFDPDSTQMVSEFLPFLVQSNEFFDHALGTSAGSLSPRTNWHDLSNFEFDLPPLDEQKRMADLLWAIEHHRSALSERCTAVSVARQARLDSEVTRLLAAGAVPFSEIWTRTPESGWSAVPGDEITGRYVLSLAALGPDGYRPGQLKNIPDSPRAHAAALRHGDLLISRANTVDAVGRVGIFTEDRADVSFPDTMMRVSLDEAVSVAFAEVVVASGHGRAHMRRSAAGSATSMVKINRTSLGRLRFPVASQTDQATLVAESEVFNQVLERHACELRYLAELRSSMLYDAFGGM